MGHLFTPMSNDLCTLLMAWYIFLSFAYLYTKVSDIYTFSLLNIHWFHPWVLTEVFWSQWDYRVFMYPMNEKEFFFTICLFVTEICFGNFIFQQLFFFDNFFFPSNFVVFRQNLFFAIYFPQKIVLAKWSFEKKIIINLLFPYNFFGSNAVLF